MNIFILPIEPIESRYSAEWHKHLPLQLRDYIKETKRGAVTVTTVGGSGASDEVPMGQFLDYAGTSAYKTSQMTAMAKKIGQGAVKDGDQIIITDAWNPGVLQLRYMLDLIGIKARIHGLWHAGSYDKTDILGRLIKDKTWSFATERAMFFAYHKNYFASAYHMSVFANMLKLTKNEMKSAHQVGWPMEYLDEHFKNKWTLPRHKNIIFPHRLSADKQIDVARLLAEKVQAETGYEMIFTQDKKRSKVEYHSLLRSASFVFSMAQHEMLGISMYEGAMHGAIPIMPRRLSYVEMYGPRFLYPTTYTANEKAYHKHADRLIACIKRDINKREELTAELERVMPNVRKKFFTGTALYEHLFN